MQPLRILKCYSQLSVTVRPDEPGLKQSNTEKHTPVGSKNLQVHMEPYLWKTRPDGINVINIGKTW